MVGRSSYRQSEIKGQALIKYNGQVSVMQSYVMVSFAEELEYNRGIEDVIARINGLYPNRMAPCIQVLLVGFADEQERAYQYLMKKEYLLEKDMDMCGFEPAEERERMQKMMEEDYGR